MSNVNERINRNENVFAGIIGSFLFSLAGGIVWFLLWQVNFLSAISGIIGVVCAIKGYSIFAKRESIKGIVISIIMTLIVMVVAWYLCLSQDVYNLYQEGFAAGEIDFTLTFGESIRVAYLFLEDSTGYYSDLLIGLGFCVIGGVGYVSAAVKRIKAEKAPVEVIEPSDDAQQPCEENAEPTCDEEEEQEPIKQNQYNSEPEYKAEATEEN